MMNKYLVDFVIVCRLGLSSDFLYDCRTSDEIYDILPDIDQASTANQNICLFFHPALRIPNDSGKTQMTIVWMASV